MRILCDGLIEKINFEQTKIIKLFFNFKEMNYYILLFLILFYLIPSKTIACFSSGNPAKGNLETEKFKNENEVISLENDQNLEIDKNFILDYLKEFGYLNEGKENKTEEIKNGIKHFQEFMNIPINEKIDLTTINKMSMKRCSNLDKLNSEIFIWKKTSINWAIINYNNNLNKFQFPLQKLKGLIKQAFNAWEIVIALDFIEVENINNADILFNIKENNERITGLGIANSNTNENLNQIWLDKNQNWSMFQIQEEGKIDIFLTLIHEIGHSLGLEHNSDQNSVMFPLLERNLGEQLPVISNDDVERLRNIYDNFFSIELDNKSSQKYNNPMATPRSLSSIKPSLKDLPEKCPHLISAATNVLPGMLIVFNEQYTWTFKLGNLTNGPNLIREVFKLIIIIFKLIYFIKKRFPDGPEFINSSFSTNSITILIQGHTLFGYIYDEKNDKFIRAKSYPKMLHNRILFYPTGAFPLLNETIILINNKVFASYNVAKNEPHMLGNLDEYFPNLPDGLLSGIPATPDFGLYYMLTTNLSFLYNTHTSRLVNTLTIGQFIGCDKMAINLFLQQFNLFNPPILKNEFPSHKSPRLPFH
ncbi:Matrix metalloproteinase [Meloidogyne graminicola]|uniref:Matrix metalloproteinase n=1 Tax=Meloidogyne graminicola TaxID=189291 RepID=A0A8T0A1K6_9BILA|nr:Matrix metalloproteinase [Meloidogyne graminicola]